MKVPCKDCPDRFVGCHDQCKKYQAFHAWRDAENEKKAAYIKSKDVMRVGLKRQLRKKQMRIKQK